MTDELEVQNEELEENLEETSTDEVVKTGKSFSQEELNKLVTQRIKREKEQARKLQEDFETQLSEKDELISKYEKFVQGIVAERSKDLPENYKKLLSKLDVFEALDFLADDTNQVSKKTMPKLPSQNEEKTPPKRKPLGTVI